MEERFFVLEVEGFRTMTAHSHGKPGYSYQVIDRATKTLIAEFSTEDRRSGTREKRREYARREAEALAQTLNLQVS